MIMDILHQEAEIKRLDKGEQQGYYFNMFQDGGFVVYRCQNMFILFEIPLYGGNEHYVKTYSESQIHQLLDEACNRK